MQDAAFGTLDVGKVQLASRAQGQRTTILVGAAIAVVGLSLAAAMQIADLGLRGVTFGGDNWTLSRALRLAGVTMGALFSLGIGIVVFGATRAGHLVTTFGLLGAALIWLGGICIAIANVGISLIFWDPPASLPADVWAWLAFQLIGNVGGFVGGAGTLCALLGAALRRG